MKKEKFIVKASDMFNVPADVKGGLLHTEIEGSRAVFFENHKGIISLGEDEIEINSGEGRVSVSGQRLSVAAMNSEEIRIVGKIEKVEFLGRGAE